MKKIICDNCGQESTYYKKPLFYSEEIPDNWIHIKIDGFYNSDDSSGDRRIIQRSGESHCCCKDCFVYDFFFSPKEIEERNKE